MAGFSDAANGLTLNAGLGADISINDLAMLVVRDSGRIAHREHIHPQSEIGKLLCDYSQAKSVLGWSPTISLKEGIQRTERWLENQMAQ